jgi:hypothetical protein
VLCTRIEPLKFETFGKSWLVKAAVWLPAESGMVLVPPDGVVPFVSNRVNVRDASVVWGL